MKQLWKQAWVAYSNAVTLSTIVILFVYHCISEINVESCMTILTCMTVGSIPATLVVFLALKAKWNLWVRRTVGVIGGCACHALFFVGSGLVMNYWLYCGAVVIGICVAGIVFFLVDEIQKKQMEKINAKLQEQADE